NVCHPIRPRFALTPAGAIRSCWIWCAHQGRLVAGFANIHSQHSYLARYKSSDVTSDASSGICFLQYLVFTSPIWPTTQPRCTNTMLRAKEVVNLDDTLSAAARVDPPRQSRRAGGRFLS